MMGEALRKRRHGTGRRSGQSWYVDETYLKVHGRWCYLYRGSIAMGTSSTRCSATRDMRAGPAVFRSARSVAGFVPDRVTTDGHNSYPRAIRSTLGRRVRHRTSVYLNNRTPDRTTAGSRGRIRCMRGFKEHEAADRFCREHDELRNFLLEPHPRHNQYIPAARRRRPNSSMHASRLASCRLHDQNNSRRALRRKRREA